jgi:rubrerythrin
MKQKDWFKCKNCPYETMILTRENTAKCPICGKQMERK